MGPRDGLSHTARSKGSNPELTACIFNDGASSTPIHGTPGGTPGVDVSGPIWNKRENRSNKQHRKYISESRRLESVIRPVMGCCQRSLSPFLLDDSKPTKARAGAPVGWRHQLSPGLVRKTGAQATLQSFQTSQLNMMFSTAHTEQARADRKKNAIGVMVPNTALVLMILCPCVEPAPALPLPHQRTSPAHPQCADTRPPSPVLQGHLVCTHRLLMCAAAVLTLPGWGLPENRDQGTHHC